MAEIIIAVIFTICSIICLIYAIFSWNCRGPILMNKYLLACDEEKCALEKQSATERKADYRYVSKLAFLLSLLWITVVFGILVDLRFTWLTGVMSVFLVIYAVYHSSRNNHG